MKAIAAVMLSMAMVFALGCKPENDPVNGSNDNGGGNDSGGGNGGNNFSYVDLGLKSGNLWANCNVGASTPEEYGDHFAWAETETKEVYSAKNYKYCQGGFNYGMIIKYCSKDYWGYEGFTDTLTVLEPGDDAATAKWGSGWRTPTYSDWEELTTTCSKAWTTQNGVDGLLLTGSNGNSIFLPAAGQFDNSTLYDTGRLGDYWSSLLCSDSPIDAYAFCFLADSSFIYHTIRSYGQSIRPVRSSK